MSKQTFDFSEALKRMRQGALIRRRGDPLAYKIVRQITGPEGYSIYMTYRCVDKLKHLHRSIDIDELHNTPIFREYLISVRDILATDWEEVEG